MESDKIEGQDRLRSISTPSKHPGKRAGTASLAAGRCFALVLALLLSASNALYGGGGHAHAAAGGESHFSQLHGHSAGGLGGSDLAPCEDGDGQNTDQDGCCMTASACGICVPVPATDLVFAGSNELAASTPPSPYLPCETGLGLRPPQLFVAA
jgi:hypothetical protein